MKSSSSDFVAYAKQRLLTAGTNFFCSLPLIVHFFHIIGTKVRTPLSFRSFWTLSSREYVARRAYHDDRTPAEVVFGRPGVVFCVEPIVLVLSSNNAIGFFNGLGDFSTRFARSK